SAAKTYDGLAYSGGNGVTYAGLVNGETASVLGGSLTYGGTSQGAVNAGSYTLTASGLTSGNYDISYVAGALTVNKASLTVTATNAAKTYDGLAYTGGNGVTYAG
ncbi:MBG domain-containing protein, partial [Pleomorphomonas sp. NRK KF1]|uniref:MBG domain-containing protein n=1 Tax=Pleomorphomonas sp. NRK KF1 TaxID=2943000 RepID=UPI002042D6E3